MPKHVYLMDDTIPEYLEYIIQPYEGKTFRWLYDQARDNYDHLLLELVVSGELEMLEVDFLLVDMSTRNTVCEELAMIRDPEAYCEL